MAEETLDGQTDAFIALKDALVSYLGDDGAALADWMVSQWQAGVPQAQIAREIREQPAYKARFPAMEYFSSQRMGVSEADYIASEREYRDAVSGLGPAYSQYFSTEFIGDLMMGGVNTTEAAQRVARAQEYIYSTAPRSVVDALKKQYGMTDGDLVAYILDPNNIGAQVIADFDAKRARADILGAATDAGLSLGNAAADAIAARDYTYGTAIGKMQAADAKAVTLSKLAAMSNGTYTEDEALAAEFNLEGANAAKTRERKLASQERARFSRTSAIGNNSLATRGLGTQ